MATTAEKKYIMLVSELATTMTSISTFEFQSRGYTKNSIIPPEELLEILHSTHEKQRDLMQFYEAKFSQENETELLSLVSSWKGDIETKLADLTPATDPTAAAAKLTSFAFKVWDGMEGIDHYQHPGHNPGYFSKSFGIVATYGEFAAKLASGDASAAFVSLGMAYTMQAIGYGAAALANAGITLGLGAAFPVTAVVIASVAIVLVAKDQINTWLEDNYPFMRDLEEYADHQRYVIPQIAASISASGTSRLPQLNDSITIGTDANETLTASNQLQPGGRAFIFGDGGDDIIIGSTGANHLKGGDGNDYVSGGEKDDLISGNNGNDLLNGYGGSDLLDGGDGNDSYFFSQSDFDENNPTTDRIIDSDGVGSIFYEGNSFSLTNFTRTTGNIWKSENGFSAVTTGGVQGVILTLTHIESGSRILVEGWANGRLGINLPGFGEPGTPENPTPTLTDIDDVWSGATAADLSVTFEGTWEEQRAQRLEYLRSRDGANHVFSGIGNDYVEAGAGDDWVVAGSGDDFVEGGSGNDRISGGSGNDILIDSGSDTYFAADSGTTPGHTTILNELATITGWREDNQNPDLITNYFSSGYGYISGVRGSAPVNDARDLLHRLNMYVVGSPTSSIGGVYASGRDRIDAGDGSDVVYAGDGNDLVDGGSGNDLLIGGHDDDVIEGGSGHDLILGDLVYREEDDDTVLDNVLQNGVLAEYSADTRIPASARANGNDTINAGDGDDMVIGGGGNDNISGDDGNDVIHGDDEIANRQGLVPGDDTIHGGAGNDSIYGGAGNDKAWSDAGDDFLQGDYGYTAQTAGMPGSAQGNDELHGGDGNDSIVGMGGDDYLFGDAGNDIIHGDHADLVESEHGMDEIHGGAGDDQIDGQAGNDFLTGDDGADLLLGGKGVDVIDGGNDNDHIEGGDDGDYLFGGDGVDMIRGNDGDDSIRGDGGNDTLYGESGNDQLSGGDGDDLLAGGIGNDNLSGGDGVDILSGDLGDDWFDGGAGNDTLDGGDGNDTMRAGTGDDTLDGDAGNDALNGDAGNDSLYGGDGNDTLTGGSGNDGMNGAGGNDLYLFERGWGNDSIQGLGQANAGTDVIRFGTGIDPTTMIVGINSAGGLVLRTPDNADTLVLEGFFSNTDATHRIEFANGTVWTMTDLLQRFIPPPGGVGTWSNDTFVGGSTPEYLDGSIGNDTILGGSGDDTIIGGMGEGNFGSLTDNDVLFGGDGNDNIDGQRGDDYLYGDDGNDTIKGGEGVDRLYGGSGNDTLDAGNVQFTGLGLVQENSDDLLVGGEGDDSLIGGLGRNTYGFTSGFGHDRIHLTEPFGYMQDIGAPAETAVLRFGVGISASSHDIAQVGDDLVITSGSDTVTIVDFALRNGASVEFLFDDGSMLSPAQQALLTVRTGSERGDILGGGGLNDVFDSLGGDDILRGGGGNDLFVGGAGLDTIHGGAGDDTIRYGVGDGRDHIYGSTADQAGFDTLELGTGINQGDVTLYRDGSALYVVVNATGNYVKANWTAGASDQSIDLIRFADGSTLTSAQIEAMTLSTPPQLIHYGNAGGTTVTGNALSNDFNTIYGGSTTQTFIGGSGDDRYIVGEGHYKPIIVEESGGGIDTLYTQHYYYELDQNVENLVATEGTWIYPDPRTFIGNALDNVIDVSSGGAYSSGYRLDGGAGADTLIGGVSNDTFVVDTTGDRIVEAPRNTSIDTVEASISYDISNRIELENIRLTGTGATSATGNQLDNQLDGSTSSGSNTLSGGLGNDTYVIGQGDIVIESANAGTDTVVIATGIVGAYSSMGFANVERYVLGDNVYDSSLAGGSGSDDLSGNTSGNTLIGGDGDDILRDRTTWTNYDDTDQLYGGDGNDTLISIRGADLLVGGRGDDTLQGNTVTFTYTRGDGKDTIVGNGSAGTSVLRFDATVVPGDIHLSRTGDSLVIDIGNDGADRITIQNYWTADTVTSPVKFIEFFDAAGSFSASWSIAGVLGRLNAMTLTGGAGDDTLVGGIGYDTLTGNDGNDTLDGGAGDDALTGGAGNDTYLFQGDFGIDVVKGLDAAGSGIDILQFAAPYGSSNVSWTVDDGDNLILSCINNGVFNQVTLEGFMRTATPAHEIRLSDGTVWTSASIRTQSLSATIDADTIFGFGSNDTIDALAGDDSVYGRGGNDNLRGGDGADILSGGDGDDHLYGDAGDDQLSGDAGTDILEGGTGNDVYSVFDSLDTIIEASASGTDAVHAYVDHTLAANVENLYLQDGAISGTGNSLNNRIEGNDLNNVINGGTGSDTMLGGAGDDLYVVDSTSDVVTETSGNGIDTIQTTVTLTTLAANVENLTLGGSSTINGTGNSLANVIIGNSANNTLNGGSGIDTLSGGGGDDIYVVDVTGDVVNELSGEGIDTVQAGANYTLSANVEKLSLSGTGAFTGTGNGLDNTLTGNSGSNTLNGGAGNDTLNGGSGTDTLIGGTGNDIYEVDTTTDVITELSGEGTDTIKSSVTFDMSGRANIENLTLTGTSAINGTGNNFDNVLTGNTNNNTLNGGAGNDTLDGGLGNDTMAGGTGDDTYYVNVSTDVVTENAGQGIDTVYSTVTFDISTAARTNIENVTLNGTGAINAIGNGNANVLIGGIGNNTLTGNAGNDTLEGGAGTDNLTGGTGNDTFVMNRGYGVDTVSENDSTAGNYDIAKFLSGVAYDQLWFTRPSGSNNLEITIIGTTDKLVVKDWYLGNQYRTEEIQTVDGNRYLLAADVQTLVTAMASLTPPAQGQTTLSASQRTALNTALGAWKTRTSLMSSSLPADLQGGGQTQQRTIDGGLSDFSGGRRQYEDAVSTTPTALPSNAGDVDLRDTLVAWRADRGFGRTDDNRTAEWHGIVFDRAGGHHRAAHDAGGTHGATEASTCAKPASENPTCAKPVFSQSLDQEWRQPDAFDVILPPLDLFMIPSTCDKTPESTLCGLPQATAGQVMSNCNRLIDLMAMPSGDEAMVGLLPQHDHGRADRWMP